MDPHFIKRLFLAFLFFSGCFASAFGQIYTNQYRPPGQEWQQLETEHFRIIFPAAEAEAAYRSARILELQYPEVQKLVGGELHRFPIIINRMSDRARGFVSSTNFRSEIELVPSKGKSMNPRSGDWLELVLPHELVHALHINADPLSFTTFIGLLSPDLRRSVHAAAPLGILEGVAVEHETSGVMEGAGRGNYPWFTNRFASSLMSDDAWSMGQLVHVSSNTLPFDRHYVGGYAFTNWLLESHGREVMKDAIEFHYKWPFFGFGFALRRTTGDWPRSLYRNFRQEAEENEEERVDEIDRPTDNLSRFIDHSRKGPRLRRPLWVGENLLLMHGTFYNSPSGFYLYDLEQQELSLLFEQGTVEDFRFTFSRENRALYYADYVADGKYDNTFTAALYRYELETGNREKISGDRLFSPSPGNPFYALQSDGPRNRLMAVDRQTGEAQPAAELESTGSIVEVQQHPEYDDLVAVVARKGSIQGLWISRPGQLQESLNDEPSVVFSEGSVFDIGWHPTEKKLLFSSDHTGTLNVYEYSLSGQRVRQMTNSRYNAFEAGYSPDGDRIAYVLQDQSRFLAAVIDSGHFFNRELPEEEWTISPEIAEKMKRPLLNSDDTPDESDWSQGKYRSGLSWLRPRTILPYYDQWLDTTYELGVQFRSADHMNRHTYTATLSHLQNRTWYDLEYQYSGFYPGFGARVSSSPSFPLIRDADGELDGLARFLLQSRRAEFFIPFRYTFRRDTRLTSLALIPEYSVAGVRFLRLTRTDSPLTDFLQIHSVGLTAVLNLRLRQFSRDVQPNAGWVLFAQTDYDLTGPEFNFEISDFRFSGSFADRQSFRAGGYRFLSPLGRWNQSLRLGAQILTQTDIGHYNPQNNATIAFEDELFPGANNYGYFNVRYTVPLGHPDDGGFLVPVYLSSLYLVFYSQTVGNLDHGEFSDILNRSRTAIGAGLRTRFRLSNLAFDIGVGFGYEPSRGQWRLIFGQF